MYSYTDIINFDWESVELGICHDGFDFVSAVISNGNDEIEVRSTEAVSCTRLRASGLKADCEYEVTVNYPERQDVLTFKTLPHPEGELLGSYAVLSDPHVSSKNENRKGRLFVESAQILQDVIRECNNLGVDFALVGGDLTNNAERGEFAELKDTLKTLRFPLICAPGDHDMLDGGLLWNEYLDSINSRDFSNDLFSAKAIDTSGNILKADDAARIKDMLNQGKIPLLVTHVHLLRNPGLKHSPKAGEVKNSAEYNELFEELSNRHSIIYAGHQNIPMQVKKGKLVQINLPQTCQFPCSWYYVRVYKNGLYHQNMPINSEILRQHSRIDSQRAAEYFSEPQWQTEYRRGKDAAAGNFLIEMNMQTAN